MPHRWMTTAALIWLGLGSAALAKPAGPPHAKPGECYARRTRPPVYATRTQKVVDRPAWVETRIVPARTETVVEQVMVSPEVVERVWREPVYREEVRWETIPGPVRRVHEAAVYREVRETVVAEPGRAVWQKQWINGQEILCKVWLPPRHAVMVHKVLVSPARAYDVQDPPAQRQVVSKVLVSAGGWSERRTPAVYRAETRVRVVEPERTVRVEHPAVYRTESSQILISAQREEWVRVRCQPAARKPLPPPPPAYGDGERG